MSSTNPAHARLKPEPTVEKDLARTQASETTYPGTIALIVSDKVVSEVVIKTAAGNVTSIITTGSVERMDLKPGDKVFAVIKTTEVSVEKQ
jgi:molybdate transport system regulatory protein